MSIIEDLRTFMSLSKYERTQRSPIEYNQCPRGCIPNKCKRCTWFEIGEEVFFVRPFEIGEEFKGIINSFISPHQVGGGRTDFGIYINLADVGAKPPYRIRKLYDENDIHWWYR